VSILPTSDGLARTSLYLSILWWSTLLHWRQYSHAADTTH